MEIKNPQWLEIVEDETIIYGLNQDWYSESFQKLAGCGPTVAATMLLYLNKREGQPLWYRGDNIESTIAVLNHVWLYVKPGRFGLYKTRAFASGVERLCHAHGLAWQCQALRVRTKEEPSKMAAFVEEGIQSDCPVAFLNLNAGSVDAFEDWHWIILTGIRKEDKVYVASGLDCGRKIEFDLGAWAKTTKMGGGFVYIKT